MTQSDLHALLDRVAETVIELQNASLTYQRILQDSSVTYQRFADETRGIVQEAKETAEHARFTANSAAAGLTGLVAAHQRMEKRVTALEGKALVQPTKEEVDT